MQLIYIQYNNGLFDAIKFIHAFLFTFSNFKSVNDAVKNVVHV